MDVDGRQPVVVAVDVDGRPSVVVAVVVVAVVVVVVVVVVVGPQGVPLCVEVVVWVGGVAAAGEGVPGECTGVGVVGGAPEAAGFEAVVGAVQGVEVAGGGGAGGPGGAVVQVGGAGWVVAAGCAAYLVAGGDVGAQPGRGLVAGGGELDEGAVDGVDDQPPPGRPGGVGDDPGVVGGDRPVAG